MAVVDYNKRFLDLTVGAPGSTHDARFLRHIGLFQKMMGDQGLLSRTVSLYDSRENPLLTVGDSGWLKDLIKLLVMKRKKLQLETKQRSSCDREWLWYMQKQMEDIIQKETQMKM